MGSAGETSPEGKSDEGRMNAVLPLRGAKERDCKTCFWSYQGSNSVNGFKLMCAQTKDDAPTYFLDVCKGTLWEAK